MTFIFTKDGKENNVTREHKKFKFQQFFFFLTQSLWFSYIFSVVDFFSFLFFLWLISCYNAAKSLQSCPTLCDPIDSSPPGSAVPGILQARTLEWVAIVFSIVWKWKVKVKLLSRVRLVWTPWTAAYQAPTSMGFSRQEYWSGLPLPSPSCYNSRVQKFQYRPCGLIWAFTESLPVPPRSTSVPTA